MSKFRLHNYSSGDSVATGLSRPKTTAILFDKIWIPNDMRHSELGHSLGYNEIPLSVCIIEEIEECKHNLNGKRLTRENTKNTDIRGFKFLPYVMHNCPYSIEEIYRKRFSKENIENPYTRGFRFLPYVMPNRPYYTVEEDVLGLDFLFSTSRNIGLKQVVCSFKRIYGIEIVPIYLGHTAFEESLFSHDEKMKEFLLRRYKRNAFCHFSDTFPIPDPSKFDEQTTRSAYEVCISNMPVIIEENLKWEQVLDMRQDTRSMKKIHRFRRWVDLECNGKSKNEIIQSLEKAIDDYKYALNKHGIMTAIGGVTTILSASSTVIDALSGGFSAQLSAGLAISSALITYTAAQLNDYFDKKREPIALIFDLEKMSRLDAGSQTNNTKAK